MKPAGGPSVKEWKEWGFVIAISEEKQGQTAARVWRAEQGWALRARARCQGLVCVTDC